MHNSLLQGLQNTHLLLIDDNPHELDELLSALRAQGARVSIADKPRKGLHYAQALIPDLILLDVYMPDMDGFVVCRLLREIPNCQDIPVIFLTSAADITDRVNGLTMGGVDYVLKPFNTYEVLARIAVHVQLSKRSSPKRQTHDVVQESQHPDQIILKATIRLIGRQLHKLPKLTEIATQVGTHDKKLSAIFRENFGMTVFAWVREERLRKAQELLINSNMSIEHISAEVGFASAANFATAFRERFSVTPSGFRQKL